MIITWDPVKNEINRHEHGISFEAAKFVFADPNRLERYDRSDTCRLISARLANKEERRIYNANGDTRYSDWSKADARGLE